MILSSLANAGKKQMHSSSVLQHQQDYCILLSGRP